MKPKHILICLACLLLLAAPAAAAGGDGTSANPYQIETAAELQSIQNDLSAHYILMNDIDLTGVTWTPIGSTSAGFFGTLDGDGHTLSNLNLSATTQNAGLFSVLTSGATIKDLTLEDCHVESTTSYCACLVARIIMSESAHETATLQHIDLVRCSATTNTFSHAGILCAQIFTAATVDITDCILINCNSIGGSTGAILCGGIHSNNNTEITNCTITHSHTQVNNYNFGVFCGSCYNSNLIVNNCVIDTCIAESVNGRSGGLFCGENGGGSSVLVENCIAKNSIIKGGYYVGGCFGSVLDTSTNVVATGCTVSESTVIVDTNYAGGIAGRVGSSSTGVFTDCEVIDCTILANTYAAGICPAYS